ncbi:leucine-rich repeat domain-containing protein [uncultured Psychroserpens sp.]|uniref:leucine-rich repeat domain-containing protein n=1 Tax=uncultured Psychroserpens sp. TaxID=255436 RepID=UPI002638F64E|nr:leucine-rich repeat domain-containing protein [uncultured Psychroserpens sp.]
MKKQLLILITICISVIVHSQTFNQTDSFGNILEYNVTSATTVQVNGITQSNINVNIPSSVTNGGTTYNVTRINDFALGGGSVQISSINLPNTLISIGLQALSGNSLTGIVFPNSLTTIDDYAFQNNQLQGITIPSNVTSIGNGVFRGNPLSTVTSLATIPPSITTVAGNNDSFVIGGDRSGINLFIPAGTTGAYVTDIGALWTGFNTVTENLNVGDTYVNGFITYEVISVANSTVKAVDYNTAGGTVVDIPATIPNGIITYDVTEIGNNAFQSKNLTGLTLPNTLTYIGENAFFINDLTTVTIPDSVVTIDNIAFAQNQNMTSLVLGNSVTSLGDASFRFTSLNTIIIPPSITNIGVVAFGGLGGINAITDVYCQGIVPPTISTSSAPNSDTFSQARSTIHLHIPAGTLGAYVTDPGALWTGFNPVTEDALSIDEFELAKAAKVITTADAIKIVTNHSLQLQDYTMYSISGVEIARGKESHISTNAFASGIYILKLNFDKGTTTKKVVFN